MFHVFFSCPSGFFPFVFLCFSIFRTRNKNLPKTHTSNKVFHKPTPPPNRVKKLDVQDMSRCFFFWKKNSPPQKKHDTTATPNAATFRPCKELMQAAHLIPHLRFYKTAGVCHENPPFGIIRWEMWTIDKAWFIWGKMCHWWWGWGPLDFLWY